MVRVAPLLLAVGALAALGWLVREHDQDEWHRAEPAVGDLEALRSEAHAHTAPAVPPPEDPRALASWFESEVLRELGERDEPQRIAARIAWAGPAGAADGIDWDYVRAVFRGRVPGIPDERRAGISLKEMDQLGDIPYVEALRSQGQIDELRELGFEPVVLDATEPGYQARFPLNPRLEPSR